MSFSYSYLIVIKMLWYHGCHMDFGMNYLQELYQCKGRALKGCNELFVSVDIFLFTYYHKHYCILVQYLNEIPFRYILSRKQAVSPEKTALWYMVMVLCLATRGRCSRPHSICWS